jgi:hypothetical protein
MRCVICACYHRAVNRPWEFKNSIQEGIAAVKITPSTIAWVALIILLLVIVLRNRTKAVGLPPHEFAHGTPVRNCEAIPGAIDEFLSLDVLDPATIQIETYVGNRSEKNLTPLIAYISSRKGRDSNPLVAELRKRINCPIAENKQFNWYKRFARTRIC